MIGSLDTDVSLKLSYSLNPIKFENINETTVYCWYYGKYIIEWYQYLLSTYFIESPAHIAGQNLAVPIPSGSISAASSMDVCK